MIKLSDMKRKCYWHEDVVCELDRFCGGCKHQPLPEDKKNGKEPPVDIKWVNDYGMMTPYCPKCNDMAYSTERCVFCGQKFNNNEPPEKNKRELSGVTEDGKCEKCGNDEFEMVAHADGADFYIYEYRCKKCGNHVTVKTLLNGARW